MLPLAFLHLFGRWHSLPLLLVLFGPAFAYSCFQAMRAREMECDPSSRSQLFFVYLLGAIIGISVTIIGGYLLWLRFQHFAS